MMMCVRFTAGILVAWLVLGAGVIVGQDPSKAEVRKVVVNSTATVYVKPESARLSFIVVAAEASDKSAREANEKQIKRIKDALAALQLGKTDVEVNVMPCAISNLGISPPAQGAARTLVVKRAQSVFEVTVREKDLDKLRDAVRRLTEAATDNGATGSEADDRVARIRPFPLRAGAAEEPESVSGPSIEWLAAETGEARRDAIRIATKNAMADAEAATGDAKLKVLEINVSAPEDIQTARIPIRVTVVVTCAY
jgi:uncharacterized protein YggE